MEGDLVPSALIKKATRSWWVFPILMILGGLAGMLFTKIQKPVYQSQGVISTAVDYAYSGRLEDYELDHLIMAVGDIIDSTTVRRQILAVAVPLIPDLRESTLTRNLTAIRKGNDWILSARATDPEEAKILAESWVSSAMVALYKMNQTALAEFHNQVAMLSIEKCYSESVTGEQPLASCSLDEIEKLQGTLVSEPGSTNSFRNRMLLTNLSFEVTTIPEEPKAALLFRQNICVAVGAFLGLLAALTWFFFLGKNS